MPANQSYEVSNLRLKFGLWYIRHKIFFRQANILILVGLSFLLYGYTVWGMIDIFILNNSANDVMRNLASQSLDYNDLRQKLQPKSLKVQKIDVLPSGEERADIIASLKNPNEKYAATDVLYRVVSKNNTLAQDSTFFLPLQEKHIVAFGVEKTLDDVQIVMDSVSWRRVDDQSELVKEKLDVYIFGEVFDNSLRPPEGPGGMVRFQITNNTVYNYYQPGFYIFLYNGPDIVRAGFTRLDIFESLERRDVEVNILTPVTFVTKVEVVPEINIFDESAFITSPPEKEEREFLMKQKVTGTE